MRERRGLCRGQRGGLPPAECFYEVLAAVLYGKVEAEGQRESGGEVTALWRNNRCMLRTRGENCARDAVIGFEVLHGLSCRREVMGNDGNKMLMYP